MPRTRKMKGGDCGCNANHVIGTPQMNGGSGFLNPSSYGSNSISSDSYYQYNSNIGTTNDPQSTGITGNLISARNLADMSSTGGSRIKPLKNSNRSNASRYKKGGNNTSNEIMNEKMNNYMINSTVKGGNAHTYNNNNDLASYKYVTDTIRYMPAQLRGGKKKSKKAKKSKKSKNKRKTKKTKKGGNLAYSIFNQMSNPISSFGTTMGAYNSASIATSQGQLGDSAVYNQPANSGYGPNNPYLI